LRTLIFYSKPGCHLCDEGLAKVREIARRHGLSIEEVDILSDPALQAKHGERIPVVELDGEELGWGRVSGKALERALARRLLE
jgi:glutaredoxin